MLTISVNYLRVRIYLEFEELVRTTVFKIFVPRMEKRLVSVLEKVGVI